MDETPPISTEPLKKRAVRGPRTSMVPKNPPTKSDAPEKSKDGPSDKHDETKDVEDAKATDKPEVADKSEKTEKVEKVEKGVLATERKQAKKAEIQAIIEGGGRGKRTPKPNPRYMDEPVTSAKKSSREDLASSEHADVDDGDDEMNHSSDEPRHEGPMKKRMLQKAGIKPLSNRKYGTVKGGTPTLRKSSGPIAAKRKLVEVDIDIDDEHGKQLFLDAKRRLTESPLISDDDHIKKNKVSVSDALAAQLRSKFSGELPVKRNPNADIKSVLNRSRLLDKSKIGQQKVDASDSRKRLNTDDTGTSEDDLSFNKSAMDPSPKNFNRRKTQHTKILSDDKIVRTVATSASATTMRRIVPGGQLVSKPVTKSPLIQTQIGSKFQTVVPTKTYSISPQSRVIGGNKPAILRPPPRILNSSLCKPTNKPTVPSLVTKLVTKDDYENDSSKSRNNNIIQSRSKENNVTSYTYTEKDGKMIPKKVTTTVAQLPQHKVVQQRKPVLPVVRTQPRQQKIISEPVSMNRYVRKITCFETWYVIRTAELHPKPERSILSLSLMQIGNEIKKVELPSDDWTYKILLQPLNKQMLAARNAIKALPNKETQPEKKSLEKSEANIDDNSASKSDVTKAEKTGEATIATADKKTDDKKDVDEKEEPKADESAEAQQNKDDDADNKMDTDDAGTDKEATSEKESDEKSKEGESTDDGEKTKKAEKSEKKESATVRRTTRATRNQKADIDALIEERTKESEEKKEESSDATETKETSDDISSDEKVSSDNKTEAEVKEELSEDSAKSNGETSQQSSIDEKSIETEGSDEKVDIKEESSDVNGDASPATHDYYTGEVHDGNIKTEERHNYRPINIMFRRKCQNPNIKIQFDRTVILKNQTFYLNVDGKNVRLVASPQTIESYEDLKILLQIVNDASLKSCCVESTTPFV